VYVGEGVVQDAYRGACWGAGLSVSLFCVVACRCSLLVAPGYNTLVSTSSLSRECTA
jgi:hypothetical protein